MGPHHAVTSSSLPWSVAVFIINVQCCFSASSDVIVVAPLSLEMNESRSDLFLTNQQPPYALDNISLNSEDNKNNNITDNNVAPNRFSTTSEADSLTEFAAENDHEESVGSDNDVYIDDSSNDYKIKIASEKPTTAFRLPVKPNRLMDSTVSTVADNDDSYHTSMMFVLDAGGEMPASVDPDMMPAVIDHNVEPIIDQLLGPRSPDESVTYTPFASMTTPRRRRRRRRTTTLATQRPISLSALELKSTTPLFGLPSSSHEPTTEFFVSESTAAAEVDISTNDRVETTVDSTRSTMPAREIIRHDRFPMTSTTTTLAPITAPLASTATAAAATTTTTTTVAMQSNNTKARDRKPSSTRRDNALKNSMCPPTGVSVIEHPRACEKYYICEDGKATLHTCPNGLLFGLRSFVLDYCVHRWNTTCGDKTQPDPIASPGCRWQFGLFSVQGSPRCSVDYYECRYGKYEVKRCPIKGQMWDERTKSCQWAEAIGCTSDALVSFQCPHDDINNTFWPRPRYYLSNTDVIECVDNKPEVLHCQNDQHVSPETLHCVDPLPSK